MAKIVFDNGDVYEGEIKDGKGKQIFKRGIFIG